MNISRGRSIYLSKIVPYFCFTEISTFLGKKICIIYKYDLGISLQYLHFSSFLKYTVYIYIYIFIYNFIYVINSIYLSCIIWGVLTYVYTWETTAIIKISDVFITSKRYLLPFVINSSSTTVPDNYWSALSHYRMLAFSIILENESYSMSFFFCMDSLLQHNKLRSSTLVHVLVVSSF